ncbi:CsgG/HfaB family protein [Massilia sp. S19_KUP03_FR1]|uniref:CsgG/HfaB family protein n=1 Tax=Massilia sp. S19_KUP03_FR1 TaxID=3025503 RepID=UPI002FCD94F3
MKCSPAALVLSLLVLAGCGQKTETPAPVVAAGAPVAAGVAATMPDVGKVDTVLAKADGYGPTPAAATADAIKSAILQVNGATIDTSSVSVKYGLDVTDGVDSVSLRATEFAERVAQKSGGAITRFKVLSLDAPTVKGGPYKASIEAQIAHYTAPVDKKLKVVVGALKFDTDAFNVGGAMVPAAKVADDIRAQVSAALTNTGRFSVLERENSEEIDQELALIQSGAAPRAEAGKLGQAVSADLVWIGHIDTLAYERHARALRTSDRELVSYSGGWGVSQKLVNVATRQVLSADALRGRAPDVAPTTLGAGVNTAQVLADMQRNIVRDIVASIVGRTFPITVVSLQGTDVVLSQGGDAVKPGARYAVVTMGAEMKDPQTGESLGRVEKACCIAVIDKVTPKLSYAHLEQVSGTLAGVAPASLQLREMVAAQAAPAAAPAVGAAGTAPARATKVVKPARETAPEAISKEDGKW